MEDWENRQVVIIGAARQGVALARFLSRHGANVVITDRRSGNDLLTAQQELSDILVECVLGEHPMSLLDGADLLCPSGGVPLTIPLIEEARRRKIPLSNDSQIFLESAPCRVIGITGSAGKSTATTLVGRIGEEALSHMDGSCPYTRIWVGGNIGNPLISDVDEMQSSDLAIIELSSFQLELMTCSPQVAAILNVTPNHLDRHGTMASYTAAKTRILAFQSEKDIAVLSSSDPVAYSLREQAKGRLIFFGFSEPVAGQAGVYVRGDEIVSRENHGEKRVMSRKDVRLLGEHNLLNVLAACAIAHAADLPFESMRAGVAAFSGLPHRLEFVRSWSGADWYNDSIATAPERAMAAINSFDKPIILLAGGQDKDLPWGEFAELVWNRVKHLILFGEAADKIVRSIERVASNTEDGHRRASTVTCFKRLQEAVLAASRIVDEGDVVLLSPGGTSFDQFHDFEDRGEAFKKWVMELP